MKQKPTESPVGRWSWLLHQIVVDVVVVHVRREEVRDLGRDGREGRQKHVV